MLRRAILTLIFWPSGLSGCKQEQEEQEEEEEKEEEGKKEEQEQEEENLLFPMMHKLSPPPFRLTSYLCISRFWSGFKP